VVDDVNRRRVDSDSVEVESLWDVVPVGWPSGDAELALQHCTSEAAAARSLCSGL
jgi:hypothetical protein